jgi:hypothetical protein
VNFKTDFSEKIVDYGALDVLWATTTPASSWEHQGRGQARGGS